MDRLVALLREKKDTASLADVIDGVYGPVMRRQEAEIARLRADNQRLYEIFALEIGIEVEAEPDANGSQ